MDHVKFVEVKGCLPQIWSILEYFASSNLAFSLSSQVAVRLNAACFPLHSDYCIIFLFSETLVMQSWSYQYSCWRTLLFKCNFVTDKVFFLVFLSFWLWTWEKLNHENRYGSYYCNLLLFESPWSFNNFLLKVCPEIKYRSKDRNTSCSYSWFGLD